MSAVQKFNIAKFRARVTPTYRSLNARAPLHASVLPVRRAHQICAAHARGIVAARGGADKNGPESVTVRAAQSVDAALNLDRVQPGEDGMSVDLATRLMEMNSTPEARDEFILFYTDETSDLAHQIARITGEHVKLGKVRWR
eukprot:3306723-Pyramimonas_sp.AAC.1